MIEPACAPSNGYNVTTASRIMVEKHMAQGESFECRFNGFGEYTIHAEPWPWRQGTVKVAP